MGAYVSDDIKAQARALIAQGKTPRQIAPQLGVTWRTIYTWLDKWSHDDSLEEQDRNQLVREYRIIEKTHRAIEDAVDQIAEAGTGAKHLIALNAIAGTLTDKILRRKQGPGGPTANVTVVIAQDQRTQIAIQAPITETTVTGAASEIAAEIELNASPDAVKGSELDS